MPPCARKPPPHTQLAYRQYGSATHRPYRQKFFHAQRSAIAPVGIVAVVSMNTIMKKNSANTPVSPTDAAEEPPLRSHQPVGVRAGGVAGCVNSGAEADPAVQHGQPWPERRVPARCHRSVEPIAPTDCETVDPEGETAERVDHEIHRRGVRAVLRSAQSGLDVHEAGLHEHHQEAGDQRPHEVDRESIVRHPIVDVLDRQRRRRIALAVSGRRDPHTRRTTGWIRPHRLRRIGVRSGKIAGQRRCRGFIRQRAVAPTRAMPQPAIPRALESDRAYSSAMPPVVC